MAESDANKAEGTIKVTIRQSSGEQFEVNVATSETVLQLKEKCKDKCNLPAESQRLIFKGKSRLSYTCASCKSISLLRDISTRNMEK